MVQSFIHRHATIRWGCGLSHVIKQPVAQPFKEPVKVQLWVFNKIKHKILMAKALFLWLDVIIEDNVYNVMINIFCIQSMSKICLFLENFPEIWI